MCSSDLCFMVNDVPPPGQGEVGIITFLLSEFADNPDW